MIIDHSFTKRITDLAVEIQGIAAPTFHEERRADFILNTFRKFGLADTSQDEVGNVYACVQGIRQKPIMVVSAHLDTVFPMETDLLVQRPDDRISGPGIGDNSLGLAGLVGLGWIFDPNHNLSNPLPSLNGDVWLVANVGEEGLGDLKGMKAVIQRFGVEPAAYIILEGMSLGQIYHRGLGVRRYRISVQTQGGHSWIDYGSPSAIHELADLVVKIKNLPVPTEPRTSINIGTISGGTSVNTIAAQASCELDLRSERRDDLNFLIEQVISIVETADRNGENTIKVCAEVIGERPPGELPVSHPLVKLALECYAQNGVNAKVTIGSTDANIPLSRGLPAICVGITTGSGAHTIKESIDTQPIGQGMGALVDLMRAIDRQNSL